MKTLISLFDYTGNWALPYKLNGWDVHLIDIKHNINIMDFDYSIFEDVKVNDILAAPPCTHFSGSGARWWKQKDEDGRTAEHLRLIYKTLEIINHFNPDFWALENPVGRLQKLVPELGKPWYFQPYWFGDPYTKKTGLFGKFNKPKKTNEVDPTEGSKMWRLYGGKSERTKELRSITPLGFAWAFYKTNH